MRKHFEDSDYVGYTITIFFVLLIVIILGANALVHGQELGGEGYGTADPGEPVAEPTPPPDVHGYTPPRHGLARFIATQCGPFDQTGIDNESALELYFLVQHDVAKNWPTAEMYGFDIYRMQCSKEQAARALMRNCETDTECESQPAFVFAADTDVVFVMYPYLPAWPDPAPTGAPRDDVNRATWVLIWDGAIVFVDMQKPKE